MATSMDLSIVSIDDHLVEPPMLWSDRLPRKMKSVGPRLERHRARKEPETTAGGRNRDLLAIEPGEPSVWCDVWRYEDTQMPLLRSAASVGFDPEETIHMPTTYDDIRPGCFQWENRLQDMDLDGVEKSLCFPNDFVRFCGQRFILGHDKQLALSCIEAYNDFLIDEWAKPSGGRLFGASILPLWDANLSVIELNRIAERGSRAVSFSEVPSWLGLPSMYSGNWDPLFAACEDAGVAVYIHVGSSSRVITTSDDAPRVAGVINFGSNTALSLTDWLLSGTLQRFARLRVIFAEGQLGWLPYLMNRIEVMWRERKAAHEVRSRLPELPRTYLRNVFFCIFDDEVGLSHLDLVGSENVCLETDYPHPDGTFPNSRDVASRNLAGLDSATREKISRTNALRLLDA
jgi:predicted TIM-barrel fold metal-dependent hydrolase